MLADPQTITIDGVANSLARTSTRPTGATYKNAEGSLVLDVNQYSTKNRFRREFRLTEEKIAADPLSAANTLVSTSVILTVDEPKSGFTNAELGNLIDAVKAAYAAPTYNKVLGGES